LQVVITTVSNAWDMLKLLRRGGPAVCNIAVTNACNATCDFCNFAYDKKRIGDRRWIDVEQFEGALEILRARDIRYISFFGGEPLLHPRLAEMIRITVHKRMAPAVITNGWLLPLQLERLAEAGLKTIYISIDAATIGEHEANRGLHGVGERIRDAVARMPGLGMTPLAQVTMNKLITDYSALAPLLRDLGFQAVAFSYPQQARLGSTTLAWSDQSGLVRFTPGDLAAAFDAVDGLREVFPVNNPRASIADMKRHLRGEPERFVCYAGYKSFYMDWNYDMWRCDAWKERLCPVWEFGNMPAIRDGCTACIADCYRDSSVMLHFTVSIGDAIDQLKAGRILAALKTLADRRNFVSLGAVMENAGVLSRLAKRG
jgi:MoaA/NifB/PqqE/SkfB family radical SAM enzyme